MIAIFYYLLSMEGRKSGSFLRRWGRMFRRMLNKRIKVPTAKSRPENWLKSFFSKWPNCNITRWVPQSSSTRSLGTAQWCIREPFCSQPWGATFTPHPSAVESAKQQSLLSSSLSSCLSLSLFSSVSNCLLFSQPSQRFSPSSFKHTKMLCLFVWQHALGALRARVRKSRARRMNELYFYRSTARLIPRLPNFLGVDLKGKKYFRSLSPNF